MKSTVDQIRQRFDNDVDRFSNLETGQTATVDAPLSLELIAKAAAATNPRATHSLDIGCGAGNYTLKLLQRLPGLNTTLIDLSRPMLNRAVKRVQQASAGKITPAQGDIRTLDIGTAQFDIIVAAAVFHHLRADNEWEHVFAKCYTALKPGGSLWISDLVEHSLPGVRAVMWEKYGEYLTQLNGEAYRAHIFADIEQEDTPRPLSFQIQMLQKAGFAEIEILHKHSCFAAFGAVKAGQK